MKSCHVFSRVVMISPLHRIDFNFQLLVVGDLIGELGAQRLLALHKFAAVGRQAENVEGGVVGPIGHEFVQVAGA